jgi:perosamine synthetase
VSEHRRIPNAVPFLGGNEWKYVKECLDTNWVSSAGPFVERFERDVAACVGVPHAVATVNGSAALHVALLAAGVGAADEVLLPSLTFMATAGAVVHAGAHPVFLDSEAVSWGLDPARVEEFLTEECEARDGRVVDRATGRRVAAVVAVHLYGHPCDLDALLALCRRWSLPLVEDSAEALGARYRGRPVGCEGAAGCLSFNGNKVITSGGGGMVLTHDAALAARVRALTTQARRDPLEWVHDEVAFNYRLTNIQAALGAAQLEQLEAFLVRKRETAEHYRAALGGLDGVCVAQEADWARSSYWMPAVLLDERRCRDVRGLIRRLDADGIQVRPVWHPLHRQPPFQGARVGPITVADRLWDRGVLLPCSVGITAAERQAVIEALTARLA